MKEKIRLRQNTWEILTTNPPEVCIELTPSDLYAQLKEQGIDSKCPFGEWEHEWEYISPPYGNQRCKKCGEERIEPIQKPKIEEIGDDIECNTMYGTRNQIVNKINEIVREIKNL